MNNINTHVYICFSIKTNFKCFLGEYTRGKGKVSIDPVHTWLCDHVLAITM